MSTATAIAALIPPLTVRHVLDAATRLADLMDEHGVTYSNIEASGDTNTEFIGVHTNGASKAEGPAAVASELGLRVESIDYGPTTTRYALAMTEFEGVKVWLFGGDLNEFAPNECGAVDEDDQGRRVCRLPKGHLADGTSCRFIAVLA